jgi:lactoylglutathione lyase
MGFCWCTINVKDLEESVRFYQDIAGLAVTNRFPAGPDGEIVFLGDGETQVELIWHRSQPAVNIGQDISLGFTVRSLDEQLAFVQSQGLAVLSGPIQPNPRLRFFFVQDPNGLRIQFVENL